MAIAEVYGSGTVPQRLDTRRMLWVKAVRKLGGTPLQSDTLRLLKAKVIKAKKSLASNNSGV